MKRVIFINPTDDYLINNKMYTVLDIYTFAKETEPRYRINSEKGEIWAKSSSFIHKININKRINIL
jgi:hypothetical protein